MKYFPSYDRIQSIVEKTDCTWQDAYAYVTENPSESDYIFNIVTHYKEGDGGKMQDLFFKFFSAPVATRCFCEKEKVNIIPKFSGTYMQNFKVEDIVICPHCGTGRLPLVPKNYEDYYKSGFFAEKYRERLTDFDHELNVAKERYEKLIKVIPKEKIKKVLDVGCAIGAFLNILEQNSIEAIGLELFNSEQTYRKSLSGNILTTEKSEQTIPTQTFDVITIYDVLEHVLDVNEFLHKILPYLKSKGFLVIEVPDMGKEIFTITDTNRHHIKIEDFEHIWYFSERGLKTLLRQYNFSIQRIDHPIVGKLTISADSEKIKLIQPQEETKEENIVVYAEDMGKKVIRVGLECGVGDVYWSLLKLKDFKEKNEIEYLQVYIRDQGEYNRNISLVECLDFVDSCAYAALDPGDVREGVSRNGVAIENGQQIRLDYFFVLSDILSRGRRVEEWLPDYKADFNIQFKIEKPKDFKKPKPMVVLFSSGESLGKGWMNGFMQSQWSELIDRFNSELNVKPIIMGANWDVEYSKQWSALVKDQEGFIDLTGTTTLPEALYLLKEADLMVGVISGMTILANHYRTPTIALYPDIYSKEFCWSWTPPGYKDYLPIKANEFIVEDIINKAKEFLSKNKKKSYIEEIDKKTLEKVGMLPGIGDIYWCLLKLEDYKKKNKIDKLVVYIYDSANLPARNFNRAGRLLDLVDFVDEYHYVNFSGIDSETADGLESLTISARENGGFVTSSCINTDGNEDNFVFMYPNAYVDKGERIEKWLPEYKVNFGMKIKTKDVPKIKQDPLVLICSLDDFTCKEWLKGFHKEEWAKLVEDISKRYKTKPVIIGAEWDKTFTDSWLSLVKNKKSYIDLVGKISFEETCGLFNKADLLISVISGVSIVANHFGTPTIVLSPDYFHSNGFTHAWVKPNYKKYYSINAFKDMEDTIIYLSDSLLGKSAEIGEKTKLKNVFPSIKKGK